MSVGQESDNDDEEAIDISQIIGDPVTPPNDKLPTVPNSDDENDELLDITGIHGTLDQYKPPSIPPPAPLPVSPQSAQMLVLRQSQCIHVPNHILFGSDFVLLTDGDPDSPTIQQALNSNNTPKWKLAIEEELHSFNTLLTWKLVDLPPGAKMIGTR
jgi:hypothetical protein